MGMSSQCALGFLTSRSNAIGRNLMQLANDKRALTREMKEVSEDYQDALSSKVLKWSNNAGATYSDLSYTNLMYPSEMNLNNPYLLTDRQGKVVVDSKYKKYAEMISPDGSPKGDWESNRIEILSKLTNIDSEKGFEFFQKFLKTNGILDELEALGIQDGDTVRMYGLEFDYYK